MSRHVALLVEDDLEMARALVDLLDSFGHACIHVATREDAERLLDAGEFCYVLLDLQIMANADSIKAHVEAGLSLLEAIRLRYREQNEQRKHLLPILVTSAHGKDHEYVVKAMQDGADDFIKKPIKRANPSLKERISTALKHSGRDRHDRCAAIMREARTAGATTEADRPCTITITGQRLDKRIAVRIGNKLVPLAPGSLALLLRLYQARLATKSGWIRKEDLARRNELGYKGFSRLKQDLAPHVPGNPKIHENDGGGRYRLNPDLAIHVDFDALEDLDEPAIAKIVAEIRRLTAP